MITVSGDNITALYTKNILSEIFSEFCFSTVKHIDCTTEVNLNSTTVNAKILIDGKCYSRTERLSDHLNPRLATTTAIGKAIFDFAKEKKRATPSYGVLTGVRPFKIAVDLLTRYDYDEVIEKLQNNYLVKSNKIDLIINTAMFDQKFKEQHAKNDVSLYISIPFCPTRCNYCSFISSAAPSKLSLLEPYVNEVSKELSLASKLIYENNLNLKSVYIGGGTPTVLSDKLLKRLLMDLRESFPLKNILEFTLEAGRPDTITEKKLDIMREFGVSRTCINPQSTNDEVLKSIGRNHTAQCFFDAVELAKGYHFDINCDIIAGLYGDTEESFKRTVDDVISLNIESITVHDLCIKKSASLKERNVSMTSEIIDECIEYSKNSCILNGYLPYYLYKQKYSVGNHENVGYCINGHECYYNIAMMNEVENVIGIGAGASSKLVGRCSDDKIEHFYNYKFPTEYVNGPEKAKSNLEKIDSLLKQR